MRFDWDDVNNRSNYRKHGVLVETAALVFGDPGLVIAQDREVDGEECGQAIGLTSGVLLLLVAQTMQEEHGEEIVRIVSAREVTARERRLSKLRNPRFRNPKW